LAVLFEISIRASSTAESFAQTLTVFLTICCPEAVGFYDLSAC